jgi:hypothetical protein
MHLLHSHFKSNDKKENISIYLVNCFFAGVSLKISILMVIFDTNIGDIIKYCSIIRIDYLLEKDSLSLLWFMKKM